MDPPTAAAALVDVPPFPDAAVIKVDHTEHPVVPLAEAVIKNDVWCYGLTRARGGNVVRPERDGRLLKLTNIEAGNFLQMSDGVVLGGMSGGPMLDLQQYGVVGLTQASDPKTDSIYGVPIEAALALWKHDDLKDLNAEVDTGSLAALRRDQVVLGTLPGRVCDYLLSVAPRFQSYIESQYQIKAPVVPPNELPEWVARQLFRLTMPQLVATLRNTMGDAFAEDARSLFSFVGACVPTSPTKLDSHWVSADSAADVRAELDSEAPRLMHLGTDSGTSGTVLLQRALGQVVSVKRCGGAAGAVSDGGVPAHERQDIVTNISEELAATVDEWKADPTGLSVWAKDAGVIVAVDPGDIPDANRLESLMSSFPGLRMVIMRRMFAVPSGSEAKVYSVAPPLNADNERGALRSIKELNTDLVQRKIAPFDVEGMS